MNARKKGALKTKSCNLLNIWTQAMQIQFKTGEASSQITSPFNKSQATPQGTLEPGG